MRHLSLIRILTSFCVAPESATSCHVALLGQGSSSAGMLPRVRKLNTALSAQPSRRRVLQSVFLASGSTLALVTSSSSSSSALDMDAFVNSELEADQKNCDPKKDRKCAPQLSQDEALCKYGQSGDARGEACKRVKAAGGQLPTAGAQGKSLGGAYAI